MKSVYLDKCLKDNVLVKINDFNHIENTIISTLLFINHRLKVVCSGCSRNSSAYIRKFKDECVNAPLTKDSYLSFSNIRKSTSFHDWEIYQTTKLNFLDVSITELAESIGYSVCGRLPKHEGRGKGKRFHLYKIHCDVSGLTRWIYTHRTDPESIISVACDRFTNIGKGTIGMQNMLKINPNWESIRSQFMESDDKKVEMRDDFLETCTKPEDITPMVRKLNIESMQEAK